MDHLSVTKQVRPSAATLLWCLVAGAVGGGIAALALTTSLASRDTAAASQSPANAASTASATVPISAEARQRQVVLNFLNDPQSAVFKDVRASKVNPLFWCGQINARNRMGGMVGFTRYVVELQQDPLMSKFDALMIDPGNEPKTDEYVRFVAYWDGYCG